jgi:heme-degrading monooxygenase HmoA
MSYVRTTIGKWKIDMTSAKGQEFFQRVKDEGIPFLKGQPGFVHYQIMRIDPHMTISVTEWQNESSGKAGAQRFRDWLQGTGFTQLVLLETLSGDVLVSS